MSKASIQLVNESPSQADRIKSLQGPGGRLPKTRKVDNPWSHSSGDAVMIELPSGAQGGVTYYFMKRFR